MVTSDKILSEAKALKADIIGLSGLITPSLDEMIHVAEEMERLKFDIPLLIGGATTSKKHTAVKIEENYSGPTIHVIDASRAVGVVSKLMNDESKENYTKEVRAEFEQIRQSRENKDLIPHLSIEEARNRKIDIDWEKYQVPTPDLKSNKVFNNYPLDELIEYIDWSPFFHAWELKGIFPKILNNKKYGIEAQKLFDDGKQLLDQIVSEKILTAKAIIGIHPAYAKNESVIVEDVEFHFPRQTVDKGSGCLLYTSPSPRD